jgi:putative transposase
MPHHVTQRGNRRQQTFFCDDDYRHYRSLMRQWCGQCGLAVWAYCLMPNHVHLILVPQSEDGLRRGVGEVHRRYTQAVNARERWTGHLWQGRFGSVVMDQAHLMRAARYIELNPVRAGLVAAPDDWPWSSAAAHVSGKPDTLAQSAWLTEQIAGWICSWREFLLQPDPNQGDLARELRGHESTGRPLGDKAFIQKLESLLGRPLLPAKRGPKPRPKDETLTLLDGN